jgi:hypothetical protein
MEVVTEVLVRSSLVVEGLIELLGNPKVDVAPSEVVLFWFGHMEGVGIMD